MRSDRRILVKTACISVFLLCAALSAGAADRSQTVDILSHSESTYGYVGGSSLLDADQALDFSCEQPAVSDPKECVMPVDPPIAPNVADSPTQISLTQLLREKTFEYLALQAAALSPSRPVPLVPSNGCVSEPQLLTAINSLPTTPPQPGQLPQNDYSLLGKFIAVSHQFYDHSLWRAAVQIDRTKSDFEKSGCQHDASSPSCVAEKNDLDHVIAAFPLLNSPSAISTIKNDLYAILGAGSSGGADAGRLKYEKTVASSPSNYYQSLFPLYDVMRGAGVNPVLAGAPWNISSSSPAAASVRDLQDTLHQLKSAYLSTLQAKANSACEASAEQLVSQYPEVTKQLVLDTPAVKAPLCSIRSLAEIRPLHPKPFCDKVSGAPLRPGKSVSISGYGISDETVSLAKDPGAPVKILLHVPFRLDPDVSPDEAKSLMAKWQSKMTDWYNCNAGNRNAPESILVADPIEGKEQTLSCKEFQKRPLKPETVFQFQLESVAKDEPGVIHLHRCWRAETNSSDCEAIRGSLIQGCMVRCKSSGKSADSCQSECESSIHAGDARNNRLDSLDWTTEINDDTVFHEMGHRLGLFDDYTGTSNTDFFQFSGPADSIMMKTDDPSARLYERHLQVILNPALGCGK